MKDFIKDYLSFTKKERAGIIIILLLIFSGILFPMLFSEIMPEKDKNIKRFEPAKNIDSINNIHNETLKYSKNSGRNKVYSSTLKYSGNKKAYYNLFEFDPNTISQQQWMELGVKEKTTNTIKNYLQKGGHFKSPSDLKKIYGLSSSDADRLIPYVKIKEENRITEKKPLPSTLFHKKNEITIIDINDADSAAFCTLPGIGPSYSKRIINFRNRLGGFYSIDQVSETYGFPDSTFQKIKSRLKLNEVHLKKIHINTASQEELRAHPYIRYKIANSIIQYRMQHGNFTKIEDLKNILLITESQYNTIQHYLTID